MNEKQDVMSPELVARLREHRRALERWGAEQRQKRDGALLCVAAAAILWIVSFVTAGLTGVVNQSTWLEVFSFFTFGGAGATTVAAFALSIARIFSEKPRRDFDVEREIE